MHDASKATLLDVVNHYNAIPAITLGLDRRLTTPPGPPGSPPPGPQRLNLSDAEKNALVAFLETLTGQSVYSDPKWSSPFDEAGNLTTIVLPVDKTVRPGEGSNEVVVSATGVPNLTYMFKSSNDLEVWSEGVSVVADAQGRLVYTEEMGAVSRFYILSYILPVEE